MFYGIMFRDFFVGLMVVLNLKMETGKYEF